ncbi:hypothetical protein, partial [Nostoc commune]|uniref:hypothetical protein n=1 Tax=Nostoc commune TaxID=1178 RepID=UPI001E5DF893
LLSELPNSSGIASKLRSFFGLTFPPRAGVLVPKTQIFLLRHIPISLVFACGIDGQDNVYLTRKFWGFVIDPEESFY